MFVWFRCVHILLAKLPKVSLLGYPISLLERLVLHIPYLGGDPNNRCKEFSGYFLQSRLAVLTSSTYGKGIIEKKKEDKF